MTGFNNMNQVEAPDYEGEFQGVVIDNMDPLFRQRIKVAIVGFMQGDSDSLPGFTKDLPWIAPVLQSPFGQGDGFGVMAVPEIASQVTVIFQKGDPHYGLSIGYLHTVRHTPAPELLINYPNRRGFRDPADNLFYIDSTEGQEETFFSTSVGSSLKIDADGVWTIIGVHDINIEVGGSLNLTVNGNCTLNVTGNLDSSADGWVHTGDVHIIGNVQVDETLTANTDVIGGGKSLKTHTHPGVTTGSGHTGPTD